jgi:hypothetical protein
MELRGGEGGGERWMKDVERRLRQAERHTHYVPGTAQQLVDGDVPLNVALVPPSTPTATNDQPQVYLTWDGRGVDDTQMPVNFRDVTVYRDTDPDFVPDATNRMDTMRGAGTLVFADTPIGVPYWYRLVASNTEGQTSSSSAAVRGTRAAGPVGLPSYPSDLRPAPGAGLMIFDATLGRPLYGDGNVWRRFDGTPA